MNDYCFEASDVRVDEFRHPDGYSHGCWLNSGYNAIRLEHLPTKVIVEAYGHRSQYVNRNKAFNMLNDILFKHYFHEMSRMKS